MTSDLMDTHVMNTHLMTDQLNTDLLDSLERLAEQNLSGISFLIAYGVTWLICALLWRRAGGEQVATYATLFQGMVALPAALGLSYAIGALGQERVIPETINTLSILIGTSQLLGLPVIIYLAVKGHLRLVPVAFASLTSMHFVLYSWLYQTPIYIGMAIVIAVGAPLLMATAPDDRPRVGPARVCLLAGGVLLATATLFLILHL